MGGDPLSIRILLVDGYRLYRKGARYVLNATEGMAVIGESDSVDQVLDQRWDVNPNIVFFGVERLNYDVRTGVIALRSVYPHARTIILSAANDSQDPQESSLAGAAGYLTRDCSVAEMVEMVQRANAGDMGLVHRFPSRQEVADPDKQTRQSSMSPHDPPTPRQREVVRLVALGYTPSEIASILGVSARTVETHYERVRERLGLQSRADLVRYAIQEGMLRRERWALTR